jgi:hypothetical protein
MSVRPLTIEDLEKVYSEMNTKWLNSPEKWCIDPKLSIEDTRTCLAIYSLDKCKLVAYTWNRLLKWLEPLLEYGTVYKNSPSFHEGLLHFTFHQLSRFNNSEKNIVLEKSKRDRLHNFLKGLSGLRILFRGLLITPTGIALRGCPSDDIQLQKLMNARNQLEHVIESVGIPFDPPYVNDICHSTLFRWTKQPSLEIIEYVKKGIEGWNEALIGELHPKSWYIGAGTYSMQLPNRKEFESFYCPTFIAHRGLTGGSCIEKENNLETLKERCRLGLYSECDIWMINGMLFLGHDKADNKIQFEDINSEYLLLHAKNRQAYEYLLHKAKYKGCLLNVFWHTDEDYVLTNHGDSIVYPGKELIEDSVFMMPENSIGVENKGLCKFICSDYYK